MPSRGSALFFALALLVVGCSSGGKQSAVTTAPPSHVPDNLITCPPTLPPPTGQPVNFGVQVLATALVPLAASYVRMCWYGATKRLQGALALTGSTAMQFEHQTNGQKTLVSPGHRATPCGAIHYPVYVLTFASHTQRISVSLLCDTLNNGVLSVRPSRKWLAELQYNTLGNRSPTL